MRKTTLAEFAEELDVTTRTLQKDAKKGILEFTKVGRTPFLTDNQKSLYLLRKRVANQPRTYAEERELEQMGFRSAPDK